LLSKLVKPSIALALFHYRKAAKVIGAEAGIPYIGIIVGKPDSPKSCVLKLFIVL
jgi:hypothetical protein